MLVKVKFPEVLLVAKIFDVGQQVSVDLFQAVDGGLQSASVVCACTSCD